jgi:hypothetical protein
VPVPNQESELSCICMLVILNLHFHRFFYWIFELFRQSGIFNIIYSNKQHEIIQGEYKFGWDWKTSDTFTNACILEYLCHKWPLICSVCHNHNSVFSSFMSLLQEWRNRYHTWITNCLSYRSTWVHPRFLVSFVSV